MKGIKPMNKAVRLSWLLYSVERSVVEMTEKFPNRSRFGGRFLALDAMSNEQRPSHYNPALNGGYMDSGRDKCMKRVLADLRTLASKGWICALGRGDYCLYTNEQRASMQRYGSCVSPAFRAEQSLELADRIIAEARKALADAQEQADLVQRKDPAYEGAQAMWQSAENGLNDLAGITIRKA